MDDERTKDKYNGANQSHNKSRETTPTQPNDTTRIEYSLKHTTNSTSPLSGAKITSPNPPRVLSRRASSSSLTTGSTPTTEPLLSPLEHTKSIPSNGNINDTFVSQQEKLLQRLQSLKESKRALLAKKHTLSTSSLPTFGMRCEKNSKSSLIYLVFFRFEVSHLTNFC
jgi:hypothetical protein